MLHAYLLHTYPALTLLGVLWLALRWWEECQAHFTKALVSYFKTLGHLFYKKIFPPPRCCRHAPFLFPLFFVCVYMLLLLLPYLQINGKHLLLFITGYNVNTGEILCDGKAIGIHGPPVTSKRDVVGIGLNCATGEVFCSHNGKYLGNFHITN